MNLAIEETREGEIDRFDDPHLEFSSNLFEQHRKRLILRSVHYDPGKRELVIKMPRAVISNSENSLSRADRGRTEESPVE